MSKAFVFCLFLLFFVLSANAQFNDSTLFQVKYAGTGILNRTNDGSNYISNQQLKFNMLTKKVELNNGYSWVYGQQRKILSNNDFFSTLDLNYYSRIPHFYYWALAVYESSYSLNINSRGQQGLGLAYRILDRDSLRIIITDGIIYEQSNLNLGDSVQKVYYAFRNSLRVKAQVRKGKMTFEGVGFYQPNLMDGNDYILKGSASLSYRFWKWLSITSAFSYNLQHLTGRENLLITFGLGFDRYF